ncbi:hypothetical protein [Priestia filamentosa]|uniref:hypothetical protein n=1 Tax=Priestia filamentosa TaxID=1402861 RepID=UPI0002EFE02D|nr:hypothetical protein [Priestia filamentosa]
MFNKITIVILSALLIVSIFCNLKFYANEYEPAVNIAGKDIKKKEVKSLLIEKYWDTALEETINNKLVNLEAKKLKLDKPNKKNLKEVEDFVQVANLKNFKTMSKDKKEEYLKNIYYIREIAKRKTIKDSELKAYIKEAQDEVGSYAYSILTFSTQEPTVANQIEKELKENKNVKDIEEEYNIKATVETIYSKEAYGVELSSLNKNEVAHITNTSNEDSDHMDHDMDSMDHDMETNQGVIKLLDKKEINKINLHSKDIINGYLLKNYYGEVIKVNNYLRSKYVVKENE